MRILKKLETLFDYCLNIMAIIAAIMLAMIIVLVSADALGRYFFNQPILWVTEISEYSLIFITFLGSAWLLKKDGHVKMEVVLNYFNKATQAILGIISSLIGVVTYTFFVWYGTLTTWRYFETGYFRPTVLEIPFAPIAAIIPIGSVFLVVQFLRRTLKYYELWKEAIKLRR